MRVAAGSGASLKLMFVRTASVPMLPMSVFCTSNPATFFTTMPPDCSNSPSSVANVMPITMSRAVP